MMALCGSGAMLALAAASPMSVSVNDSAAAAALVWDEAALAQVQRHPGYPAAAREAVAGWIGEGQDPALLQFRDLGRFIAALWAFHLSSEPGGLTRSRLETLLQATGAAGVARAPSILLFLRFIKYIQPDPRSDARSKRYQPTPLLSGLFDTWLRSQLSWAAALDTDIAAILERFDDPAIAAAFRSLYSRNSITLFLHNRVGAVSLDLFSHRFGGLSVLGSLLQAADTGGEFPPVGLARFNVSQVSKRSGGSRSQVRALLRDAEKSGFLADLAEGEARLTPLLAEHVGFLIAGMVLMLAWTARGTLAEQGESSRIGSSATP